MKVMIGNMYDLNLMRNLLNKLAYFQYNNTKL